MKKLPCLFLFVMAIILTASAQQRFSAELLWGLKRVSDAQVSPDGKQILFGVTSYNISENKGKRDIYLVATAGGETTFLDFSKSSVYNAIWRSDGRKIAFMTAESGSMQMYEADADGSNKKQISNIEGGITGFTYAPGLKHMLFTRQVKLDITPNDRYPDLPKANARIEDDLMYRHWDSWHDYTYSHIFVAPYEDGKVLEAIDIMPDERWDTPMKPFGGLEQIAWSPDGKKVAYTCKKLIGKAWTLSTNSAIYIYDLEKKTTLDLTPGLPGYDQDPVFSPDGKMIAWRSMETPGFEADKDRIMVHEFSTGKTTDYSTGFDQSSEHFVWSADSRFVYFISGINATYQLYSLEIKTRKITQVTKGWHNYQSVSLAGTDLVGMKMTMGMPSEIFRIDMIGNETQLTFTNKEILKDVELAKVEQRWVETTDGKQMLVWVILPPGFDANKKYPALLYCQGGPQSSVSQFFSYRWNFQMMAANDYVVIAPNRRGLPTFGQEWNDQISGDYGGQNMQDYLSAVDALAKEPWVDETRLGAIGASYGGFSVYWLAGNHNKRFKAFIAHCGMFNFESKYGTTEEYFFPNYDLGGPYWEEPKPKSYDFSPHRFVGRWDTPILVIHGANDFRVTYSEGMQAFSAAQLRGIPSRFLFFPDESHFVLKPQNAILWQREFFRWLDQWLK
ncbi:MAG: S9 family peptidase [Bacteroidales bacterium]|nr:S9 family peptidase [Bacteroidales bacterium]MDZ4205576.1 S9 family peptidase [Bacteroidales bacterium]